MNKRKRQMLTLTLNQRSVTLSSAHCWSANMSLWYLAGEMITTEIQIAMTEIIWLGNQLIVDVPCISDIGLAEWPPQNSQRKSFFDPRSHLVMIQWPRSSTSLSDDEDFYLEPIIKLWLANKSGFSLSSDHVSVISSQYLRRWHSSA